MKRKIKVDFKDLVQEMMKNEFQQAKAFNEPYLDTQSGKLEFINLEVHEDAEYTGWMADCAKMNAKIRAHEGDRYVEIPYITHVIEHELLESWAAEKGFDLPHRGIGDNLSYLESEHGISRHDFNEFIETRAKTEAHKFLETVAKDFPDIEFIAE